MKTSYVIGSLAVLLFPLIGRAQQFGTGGAGLFEPEIDVVNSGAILDAQATVSADRKYVTMTMRPQNTQLLALRQFAFQTGQPVQGGIVGGVNPATPNAPVPRALNGPARLGPGRGGKLLMQRGMTPVIQE